MSEENSLLSNEDTPSPNEDIASLPEVGLDTEEYSAEEYGEDPQRIQRVTFE